MTPQQLNEIKDTSFFTPSVPEGFTKVTLLKSDYELLLQCAERVVSQVMCLAKKPHTGVERVCQKPRGHDGRHSDYYLEWD